MFFGDTDIFKHYLGSRGLGQPIEEEEPSWFGSKFNKFSKNSPPQEESNFFLGKTPYYKEHWGGLDSPYQAPQAQNQPPPMGGTTLSNLFSPNYTPYSGYNDAVFNGEDDENWWRYY